MLLLTIIHFDQIWQTLHNQWFHSFFIFFSSPSVFNLSTDFSYYHFPMWRIVAYLQHIIFICVHWQFDSIRGHCLWNFSLHTVHWLERIHHNGLHVLDFRTTKGTAFPSSLLPLLQTHVAHQVATGFQAHILVIFSTYFTELEGRAHLTVKFILLFCDKHMLLWWSDKVLAQVWVDRAPIWVEVTGRSSKSLLVCISTRTQQCPSALSINIDKIHQYKIKRNYSKGTSRSQMSHKQ